MNWPKLIRLRQAIVKGWQSAYIVWRSRAAMKKEEARRAVLSEYDRWAKKHPNDARMMLPILTGRKVGPSRFPCGWQQVANRSRLPSRSVERLASVQKVERRKGACSRALSVAQFVERRFA